MLDGSFDLAPELIPDLSLKERKERAKTAGLIITHTGYILDYVNADRGQVLYKGHLCCQGRPRDILDHIRKAWLPGMRPLHELATPYGDRI